MKSTEVRKLFHIVASVACLSGPAIADDLTPPSNPGSPLLNVTDTKRFEVSLMPGGDWLLEFNRWRSNSLYHCSNDVCDQLQIIKNAKRDDEVVQRIALNKNQTAVRKGKTLECPDERTISLEVASPDKLDNLQHRINQFPLSFTFLPKAEFVDSAFLVNTYSSDNPQQLIVLTKSGTMYSQLKDAYLGYDLLGGEYRDFKQYPAIDSGIMTQDHIQFQRQVSIKGLGSIVTKGKFVQDVAKGISIEELSQWKNGSKEVRPVEDLDLDVWGGRLSGMGFPLEPPIVAHSNLCATQEHAALRPAEPPQFASASLKPVP